MKSQSNVSGALLCIFLVSQCWADLTAHSPPNNVPVQRGRSDAYYSCLETFENSDVPQEFLDTICGTLGNTIPVLKTSAYCGLANNLLERCYDSTSGTYQQNRGGYEQRPYENNRQRPYNGENYDRQPYDGQPYDGQPYNGQPYNGQPNSGDPYNGQPYDGQPYYEQPPNGNPRVRGN